MTEVAGVTEVPLRRGVGLGASLQLVKPAFGSGASLFPAGCLWAAPSVAKTVAPIRVAVGEGG